MIDIVIIALIISLILIPISAAVSAVINEKFLNEPVKILLIDIIIGFLISLYVTPMIF